MTSNVDHNTHVLAARVKFLALLQGANYLNIELILIELTNYFCCYLLIFFGIASIDAWRIFSLEYEVCSHTNLIMRLRGLFI